ncbi:ATP-binding protein [Polyangium spumosum]|uniref:histidine kinase n=1 Tax=Polyangium spumosum TaxID=889282 RepID=A0A6N7PQ56_9BACT|nr:ATP-binding protein [Polyangium spumosum]MRG92335.1 FHA domain-containing protein [Polyangium spumosum]
MPTLVYNPGEPDERSFPIGEASVTIGRAEDQGIYIPHKSLSRSHARIEPSEGRFFVVDLESKNGTLVNGMRVKRKEIKHGDTVTLGDLDLLFRVEDTQDADRFVGTHHTLPQATRALLRSPIARLVGEPGTAGSQDPGARAHGRLRILMEVAKLLPVSDDIDSLLRRTLDLVFQILDVDRGVILLIDEQTRALVPRVMKTAQPAQGDLPIYSENIVEYVLRKSVAALFADAVSDARLGSARSVVVQSIRASMCVPLKPRDDVIGVLYVDNLRATHLFSEDDLDFLVAFASQVAVAIENARLYRRVEQETVARMQLIMEAKLASLGAMVSGIAHELRNPLHFMMNFAEISTGLAADLAEALRAHGHRFPDDARTELDELLGDLVENTRRISEHGRRASTIIQNMTQHARRTAGAREAADLNTVVTESVHLARKGPHGAGLELKVVAEYDPAIGPVEMVTHDMGRVFLNVVENALDAMREKQRERGPGYVPELRVSTAGRGDQVEVHIRDNGTGIPKRLEERIFEPFFTTKPSGQGTGLGLSLSHEIVVLGHQGSMRVETVPGEFAEFVITIPRGAGGMSRR